MQEESLPFQTFLFTYNYFSNTPLICYWLAQQEAPPPDYHHWSNQLKTIMLVSQEMEGQVEQIALWDIVKHRGPILNLFWELYHVHNIHNTEIVVQ